MLQSGDVRWHNDTQCQGHVPLGPRVPLAGAQAAPSLVAQSKDAVHVHGEVAVLWQRQDAENLMFRVFAVSVASLDILVRLGIILGIVLGITLGISQPFGLGIS